MQSLYTWFNRGPGTVIAAPFYAAGNLGGTVYTLSQNVLTLGTVRSLRKQNEIYANNVGERVADFCFAAMNFFLGTAQRASYLGQESWGTAHQFEFIRETENFLEKSIINYRGYQATTINGKVVANYNRTVNTNLFKSQITARIAVAVQGVLRLFAHLVVINASTFQVPAAIAFLGSSRAANTLACACIRDTVNLVTYVIPDILLKLVAPTPSYNQFSPSAIWSATTQPVRQSWRAVFG